MKKATKGHHVPIPKDVTQKKTTDAKEVVVVVEEVNIINRKDDRQETPIPEKKLVTGMMR